METILDNEGDTLELWQKEDADIFDYFFEFVADEECESVDLKTGEQYYIKKLVETYYQDQIEYSTTSKYCFPVSSNTKHKIIQYFENPNIKFLFE